MSVFCTYPWKQLFSDSYGVYMPCCMATVDHPHDGCWHGEKSDFPAPKVNEISPSEFFYSDYMKQLKKQQNFQHKEKSLGGIKDMVRQDLERQEIEVY